MNSSWIDRENKQKKITQTTDCLLTKSISKMVGNIYQIRKYQPKQNSIKIDQINNKTTFMNKKIILI